MDDFGHINPLNNPNLPPPQKVPLSRMNLSRPANASNAADLFGGQLSSKELQPMVKMLATRLQISELMAFKLLRKFMGTGQAGTFNEMSEFLADFVKGFTNDQAKANPLLANLRNADNKAKSDKDLEQVFKPMLREMRDSFVQAKQTNIDAKSQLLFGKATEQVPVSPRIPVTELVSSPRLFASWLINNKSAFISMKANPRVTYLLTALQNPKIQQSPVLLAEIAKLITQILKIRRGKSQLEIDDEVKENLDAEATQEAIDHEANIVHMFEQVVEAMPLNPLKDFLLEAERFAEEEIANMWSLALKKEKELENQLKEKFEEFKKDKDR